MGARASQCFVKNGGVVGDALGNHLEQPQVPKAADVVQSLEAKAIGSESQEPLASLPEPDPEQGVSPSAEKIAVEKKAAEEKAAVEKAKAASERKAAEETAAAENAAAAKAAAAAEKAAAEKLAAEKKAAEEVEKAAAAKVAAEKAAAERLVAETKAAAEKQATEEKQADIYGTSEKGWAAEEPATSSKPVEADAAVLEAEAVPERQITDIEDSMSRADSKTAVSNEKRVDPLDGRTYTFEQLSAFYKDKFNESEVQAYWDKECKQGNQVPKKKGNNKKKNKA